MTHARAIAGLALAVGVGAACSSSSGSTGELMVVVQTDMSIPKDVDLVRIEVDSYEKTLFAQDYKVGPSGLRIPATLGIVQGSNPSAPVTIRVIARQSGKARMLREAVTTVPTSRLASLRMPIQWLCDGRVLESTPGVVTTTCAAGQTCDNGSCVAASVDSASLPTYSPSSVFGGGTGSGDGKCFDTLKCFDAAIVAAVDPASCTAPLPAGAANANFAIRTPPGSDGICSGDDTLCVIPLDAQVASGWYTGNTSQGPRAILPQHACDLVKSGGALSILTSTACPAKPPSLPTCGAWSSAGGGDVGTTDASAPVDATTGPQDASAPDSSDSAPASSCTDGVRNGNETDVDCGGSCPPCALTRGCATGADCISTSCGAGSTCTCAAGMVVAQKSGVPFCIDTTEVTNAAYTTFLAGTAAAAPAQCAFKTGNYAPNGGVPAGKPNLPVANVDSCDAFVFCATNGKHLCGNPGGFATPSAPQDEWFSACSAGGTLAYPYGATYAGTTCNGADYGAGAAIAAGQDTLCLTSSGALDMSGNVAEWEDACNANVGNTDSCLARGGSYASTQVDLACAGNIANSRDTTDVSIGFRCCATD